MNEEIKAIIEKDLPAQVGKTLQKVLLKGEEAIEQVKELKEELRIEKGIVTNRDLKIDNYKALDTRNEGLEAREKVVADKEIKLEIEMLKVQLTESEKRADMVKEFTSGLVRNTTFRKTAFGTTNVSGAMNPQGYQEPPQLLNNDNEETTTED